MKLNIDNTVAKRKEENSAEDIEMMTEVLLQDQMTFIRSRENKGTKKPIKSILIEMIKRESIIKRITI